MSTAAYAEGTYHNGVFGSDDDHTGAIPLNLVVSQALQQTVSSGSSTTISVSDSNNNNNNNNNNNSYTVTSSSGTNSGATYNYYAVSDNNSTFLQIIYSEGDSTKTATNVEIYSQSGANKFYLTEDIGYSVTIFAVPKPASMATQMYTCALTDV